MNKLFKIFLGIFCFSCSTVFAGQLSFTVTNLSKSVITFGSTDIFDFGTAVNFNETQTHTYNAPPKNMTLNISNGPYTNFYMMTDPSCDELGFKPLRELTKIEFGGLRSNIVRYGAGNVSIVITDMDDSTVLEKKITCSRTIQ